jgi:tellurite resistance protein
MIKWQTWGDAANRYAVRAAYHLAQHEDETDPKWKRRHMQRAKQCARLWEKARARMFDAIRRENERARAARKSDAA